MYKKKVKIVNQGSAIISIPKAIFQMMNLCFGEYLQLTFNPNKQEIIVTKIKDNEDN